MTVKTENREKVVVKVDFHFCRISLDSMGGWGGGGEGEEASLAQFLKCLMLQTQILLLSFWTSVPPLIWLTIKLP